MDSLYDRYGGVGAASAIVHGFYKRVLESPSLAPYFAVADMERLINRQVRFFSAILGGPNAYDDGHLAAIHQRLGITPAAFDEAMQLLALALDDAGFRADDKQRVLDALAQYRAAFVSAAR